jgi:hypothetical protein
MIRRNSGKKRAFAAASLLAICFAAANRPVLASDKEFGLLVRHVESYYHAKRNHRFLLGFAGLVVRIWRPYGVKGFRMALFEDQDFSSAHSDLDFAAVVRAGLRDGWQPMVRVYSRRQGEHTVIFAKPAGNDLKLLIATVEPDEAVVMQMKLNPERLSETIDHWSQEGRSSHENSGARHSPSGRGDSQDPTTSRMDPAVKNTFLAGDVNNSPY